ncbi:hypothetical protein D3C78_976640 [compost metagenome]
MGNPNGEDEEGHQYGIGVQIEPQCSHQAELPYRRDDRAENHQCGAAKTAGVDINDEGGDNGGDGEVEEDLDQPIDQVPDQFGEANDVDPDRGRLMAADSLLQIPGQGLVVKLLASGRINVQQRNDDHRGLQVGSHQAADHAGAVDVLPQKFDLFGRAVIGGRQYRPTGEPLLGHLHPSHRRGPDRLHPGPVDAGDQHQFIVDSLESFQVLSVEYVAIDMFDHDADGVAEPSQLVPVFNETPDVRMVLRNHPFKTCVDVDVLQLIAQRQGQCRTEQQHDPTIVEDHALEPTTGCPVERPWVGNDRHIGIFVTGNRHNYSPLRILLNAEPACSGHARHPQRPTCRCPAR